MSDTTTSTLDDVTKEIVTGIAKKAKIYDIIERVVWTLLQVTTGEVLINLLNGGFVRYNTLYAGHVLQLGQEWVILFTFLIAALKNVIASQLGNGTASTLPAAYEPVLPTTVTTTTTVDTTPVATDPVTAPVVPDATPSPDSLS